MSHKWNSIVHVSFWAFQFILDLYGIELILSSINFLYHLPWTFFNFVISMVLSCSHDTDIINRSVLLTQNKIFPRREEEIETTYSFTFTTQCVGGSCFCGFRCLDTGKVVWSVRGSYELCSFPRLCHFNWLQHTDLNDRWWIDGGGRLPCCVPFWDHAIPSVVCLVPWFVSS